MAFTVAIVGRPNVGKSTLFNRLVGKRVALVDPTPGVTRDRREGEGHIGPLTFRVIDTAGLEEGDPETMAGRMRAQTDQALGEADLLLFVVDARAGLVPEDRHFADAIRRAGRPVVLIANKAEGDAGAPGVLDAFELGMVSRWRCPLSMPWALPNSTRRSKPMPRTTAVMRRVMTKAP